MLSVNSNPTTPTGIGQPQSAVAFRGKAQLTKKGLTRGQKYLINCKMAYKELKGSKQHLEKILKTPNDKFILDPNHFMSKKRFTETAFLNYLIEQVNFFKALLGIK